MRNKLKKIRNDDEMLATMATAGMALDENDLFLVTGGAQYEMTAEQLRALVESGIGLVYNSETRSLDDTNPIRLENGQNNTETGVQDYNALVEGFGQTCVDTGNSGDLNMIGDAGQASVDTGNDDEYNIDISGAVSGKIDRKW